PACRTRRRSSSGGSRAALPAGGGDDKRKPPAGEPAGGGHQSVRRPAQSPAPVALPIDSAVTFRLIVTSLSFTLLLSVLPTSSTSGFRFGWFCVSSGRKPLAVPIRLLI